MLRAFLYTASLIAIAGISMNDRPVIGIYPTMTLGSYKPYKQWLAQEGADSLMLPQNFTGERLEELFNSINGVLIPGGSRDLAPSAHAIVNRAVQANADGDYFPVLGTCLGYEWLVEIFGGRQAITRGWDAKDLAGSLSFTAGMNHSRTYAAATQSLKSWIANEPITYNDHHLGLDVQSAKQNKALMDMFDILATEPDRQGRVFVAQIEGRKLPIYGNQFHAEKIQFLHSDKYLHNIPRDAHAVDAAKYFAQFFVNETRKSRHVYSLVAFDEDSQLEIV